MRVVSSLINGGMELLQDKRTGGVYHFRSRLAASQWLAVHGLINKWVLIKETAYSRTGKAYMGYAVGYKTHKGDTCE